MVELYDLIYSALPRSAAYRAVLAEFETGLPSWVTPLSSVDRALLERMAAAMKLRDHDTFVDIACGLGGPALWIAQQTNAHAVGVDFSSVAISSATALAARLGLQQIASFFARDATRTELQNSSIDAVMSIDALQFIEPESVSKEVARILRPGGRAVIVSWEALTDIEIPTVVRDYRPYLDSAGLVTLEHDLIERSRERELILYRSLKSHADALRSDMGEAAEPLLHEAEAGIAREHAPLRVQKVFIVAEKPI